LSNDKAPALRNFTVLPLLLKPDIDENLARMTEGRLNTFSHDIVPDYLRTKPEPDAEMKMMQLEHKASCVTYETAQVCKFLICFRYFPLSSLIILHFPQNSSSSSRLSNL
jgi:hypothetical protein